jgi:hypothetical protein
LCQKRIMDYWKMWRRNLNTNKKLTNQKFKHVTAVFVFISYPLDYEYFANVFWIFKMLMMRQIQDGFKLLWFSIKIQNHWIWIGLWFQFLLFHVNALFNFYSFSLVPHISRLNIPISFFSSLLFLIHLILKTPIFCFFLIWFLYVLFS